MAKGHRAEKLGGEIKRIIGSLLVKQQLKDPRLQSGMISVSEVEVSRDGSYATVYIMAMGVDASEDDSGKSNIIEAFRRASGFIRKEIAKKVKVRHIPELRFRMDTSLDYAMHMSEVIDSLNIKESVHEWEESDYLREDDTRLPAMRAMADTLMSADSIYIFSHYVADGDTIGSATSLCRMMRDLGKDAVILIEDEVPDNLKFLTEGLIKHVDEDEELEQRDLCIAVDCSNSERFPKREKIFFSAGRTTANIDHHTSNDDFADVNLVDSKASATAELLYELYRFMSLNISKEIGEAIYTGIVTDTGNFQYTNTTKKTHIITSELYDTGIDTKSVNIILFQSERVQKLKLHSMIMGNMEMFCDNRCAMAYVTLDMYEKCDAKTDESDGINGMLRDIKGVELAIFMREKKQGEVKVGFRSKDYFDVAKLCETLGGGGHAHAAGCTVKKNMEDTIDFIRGIVEEKIAKLDAGETEFLAADAMPRD